ncbi:ganglioside GM2 activator [Erpetoichthys calabaricus]|uniref:Ganglioside GM2 activator n=1 Tax=Erpetoichthys calabaricus TaxID=27687 RepID=A0A8C4T3N0_ERPCA|nr:ganglioside GM2 activator [Erpetoichthys calabaricus]
MISMKMAIVSHVYLLCIFIVAGTADDFIFRKVHLNSAKAVGFSWSNCGGDKDPAVMNTMSLSPDPIVIPGDLKASAAGSTAVALSSPLSVNVTLHKEVAGFWVKVPCVEQIGSCDYEDVCQLLDTLIPPGQDCPEPLHTYGIPCHCPFKSGDYTLPEANFYLPQVDLPYWLTNGNYEIVGVLGNNGQQLGCLKVTLSIHTA